MTLSPNERYELKAAAFTLHTHYFPPGKDSACAVQLSEEEIYRARGAWDTWIAAYGGAVECVISAVNSLELVYKQAYEDAMLRSNEAGLVGYTPAQAIVALREERDAALWAAKHP